MLLLTEKIKKKRIAWNKGMKGQPAYWKGKKMPKEACEKMKKADRTLTSGKNHYNWRGGITSLAMQIRNSLEYKTWRKRIFERDNYTCVLCHIRNCCGLGKSVKIHADHFPLSFSEIIHELNIQSKQEALNCEILFDMNNARTLCVECHKKTDNYCGRNKYGKNIYIRNI